MNDRQRYAVGIAAAVLIHLFAAVSYTHLTLPTTSRV